MKTKNKLELTWIGKDKKRKIEPRILIEDKEKSYGDVDCGNLLIHGDNLLALKSLEQDFSGKIKCIYIDPPYNTGNAFEHYDDNVEHSIWLSLMYERIKLLYRLLSNDGTIWISIDDIECHYLKVMCDEIFGRKNFLGDIAYERSGTAGIGQGGTFLVNTRESILVYAKDKSSMKIQEARTHKPLEKEVMKRYSSVLKDEGNKEEFLRFKDSSNNNVIIYKHSNYQIDSISLRNFEKRKEEIYQSYNENYENIFRTTNPQKENTFQQKIISSLDSRGLYSVEYIPSRGKFKGEKTTLYYNNKELCAWLKASAEIVEGNIVKTNKMSDFWRNEDIPKANLANEGNVEFKRSKKPEALIKQILDIATEKGDYVLDSFLGSGTTCAVAHKMNRKWIGIEMGDHIYSHCIPRLNSIIDGRDLLGITKQSLWTNGGGYKFYELAPSLLSKDKYDNWVISNEYDADMLAEAMAKHNGFKYIKNQEVFYKQGYSTEKDFIFTTTNYIDSQYLDMIHELLSNAESLLICCKSYEEECEQKYQNISLQKIPQSIMKKYEFGDVNYTLNIEDEIIGESEDLEEDEQ